MSRKATLPKSPPRGVVTAMFTDIVGSSRLKELMNGASSSQRDSSFVAQIKQPHDQMVMQCVEAAGGHRVNSTGDGWCCTFHDPEAAVLCSLRIQEALCRQPIETPLGPLTVRIGLHTGFVDLMDGNDAAATLDKAAGVQVNAAGGEVLVSRETEVLVGQKLRGVSFEEVGEHDLKGIRERLYRVIHRTVRQTKPLPLPPPQQERVGSKLQNPYNFSGMATRRTFKGREGELNELLDSIETGTHTAIFGLQRMGKTSLIKEGLEDRLQQLPDLGRQVLLADIDLMKLGGDEVTYKDLFHAIVQAITEKLLAAGIGRRVEGLRTLTNELWATSRYERGDRTQFFAMVSKVLAGLSDIAHRRIVLFIDEFSELRKLLERNNRAVMGNPLRTKNLFPHEMFVDLPFVHHLSALLKDPALQEKFTLIVAVRPFMAEYDAREGLQVLKLMKPITLYYLEESAAKALITEPIAGQIEYAPGVVDYLYQMTAGHPYLLQFMLKNVVDKVRRERRGVIDQDDVTAFEERMVSHGPAYDAQFEVVVSDYSVAEVMHPQEALLGKGVLALIAKVGEDESPEGWVSEDRVFDILSRQSIAQEKSASLLSQLVRTKILEEADCPQGMRYRIAIPLLRRRFVRQNLYLKYFR